MNTNQLKVSSNGADNLDRVAEKAQNLVESKDQVVSDFKSLLSEGEALPVEFSRPEVAKVLQAYYAGLSDEQNVKIEMKGHSAK